MQSKYSIKQMSSKNNYFGLRFYTLEAQRTQFSNCLIYLILIINMYFESCTAKCL